MPFSKPLPSPTDLSRPFWDGARAHKLMLQRCRDCRVYRFTPQILCRECHSEDYDWEEVSGRGTVWSWSTIYRPQSPAFSEDVPYIEAIVELEEGPKMLTNVVGVSPDEIYIGQPVEVHFEDATDEISLPKFRPTSHG